MLHLLPCNLLRNNVRAIKKLNKRFINAKYGKIFNETCISEKLFPKFANIYIFNNTLNYYIFKEFHNKCNGTKHFL